MHAAFRVLLLLLAFIIFSAEIGECRGGFLGGGGGSPGGGGPPVPTQPPAPTPTPSHTWLLLPGCCDVFSDWGGTPDHHDGPTGSHAVDIGINGGYCDVNHVCTPNCGGVCQGVYYYDTSNSVSPPATVKFDVSCGSGVGGGQRVQFDLFSLDPAGQNVGTVRYLHLMNAVPTGTTVTNGTRLGTVSPLAGWDCWTGPHLHQEITPLGSAALLHLTGPGQNCPSNGPVDSSIPCYKLSW